MGSNSATLNNLSSGTYTTYILDFNQCKDTLIFLIGNLSTVSLNVANTTTVKCHNGCTGEVLLNALNGTAPYTFSISGLPTSTNNLIQGLCPGLYFIHVLDANLCPATTTLLLSNPAQLSYTVAQPATICLSQSSTLSAQVQGGTGGYSYLWLPGNLTSPQIVVSPNSSTVYSLSVFDANVCTNAPYQVSVNVNAPLSVSVNPNFTGICPGTTAQITPTVNGGDGIYTYLWLPGNSTQATLFIENITVSSYTFVVKDNCGSPPATKIIDLQVFEVIPPTFTLSANKGCAPFCPVFINTLPNSIKSYWNYGDDANEQIGDTTTNCYLKAGYYNVLLTVLDQHSCTATSWFEKAIEVFPQPKVDFITNPSKATRTAAQNLELKDISNDAEQVSWYLDGVYQSNQKIIVLNLPDTLCYQIKLIAKSSQQCVDSASKQICVKEDFNFYMPNVFTPNNDGLNDVLKPMGTGWDNSKYKFEVYDQWGGKQFSTTNVNEGWTADYRINPANAKRPKADKEDVYLWFVEITDLIGEKHKVNGSVMILR